MEWNGGSKNSSEEIIEGNLMYMTSEQHQFASVLHKGAKSERSLPKNLNL
jgi:hypothetical protein